MAKEILRILLLLPFFFAVEFARGALWAARAVDEPDRDGSLLRAFVALLVSFLAVVPKPVWTLVMYVAWLACMPVQSMLWLCGVGRENIWKRSPGAVTRWYAHRRARHAKMRSGRHKEEHDSECMVCNAESRKARSSKTVLDRTA